MRKGAACLALAVALLVSPRALLGGSPNPGPAQPKFQISERCLACHNGLITPSGKDVSIGLDWRASIMANSSRDPYWQGSVRRETLDHPQARATIEDECSICHMPMARYEAKLQGHGGQIFSHLPFTRASQESALAEDGVSCSVCHQIGKGKLGTRPSFNGGFVIDAPDGHDVSAEYGPFAIAPGQQRIMESSTGGFRPTPAAHIRESEICATCHTLYTAPVVASGEKLDPFPEQMPFLEWLHSDYRSRRSCQACHMPEVREPSAISAVLSDPRSGWRQHTFVGANFFMLKMLDRYREELAVAALPAELEASAEGTTALLQSQAARVSIRDLHADGRTLQMDVLVQNLTGHKLPTAYPSRRAWLHVTVADHDGREVFESGHLNRDGSIVGNDNDADAAQFEPHYREITSAAQVQIYEPILRDQAGHVTTGLLSAVAYVKDNRLLPLGFEKQTAGRDIAVMGEAAQDPDFTGGSDRVRYSVPLGGASGPFHVVVELWYQPIGFRWAHNLASYSASEPQRFVRYYDSMSSATAVVLALAQATH